MPNKFVSDFDYLIKEWNFEKNNKIGYSPFSLLARSNKKVWWKDKYGHEWQAKPCDRVNDHTGCPYCANRKVLVGYNDLKTTHPEVANEWHPTKNGNLKPTEVVAGSSKKVWWKGKCGHEWSAVISSRATNGRGCPYCNGNKILVGFNDFATKYPEQLREWDYDKNIISPNKIFPKSKQKYWWKCEKGHSYLMSIDKKTSRKFGCPICSGHGVEKGVNDLETINPSLAKEWHPTKNGNFLPSEITVGSGKKVWWICKYGHEWQASPHDRHGDNTGCPICRSRMQTSFPEQAIYFYIKKLFPDSINRYKNFAGSDMELDVFVPSSQLAIEYDGRAWHRTNEEHERERKKYLLCKANKITLIRIKEKHPTVWKDTADSTYLIEKTNDYSSLQFVLQHILDFIDTQAQLEYALRPSIDLSSFFEPQNSPLFQINNSNYNFRFHHSSVIVDIKKDRKEIQSYLSCIDNSLANLRPDIAKEWDKDKNYPLKPEMFSLGSYEDVWWICPKCGKSFKATIKSRTRALSLGCPECAQVQSGRTFTLRKVKEVGSLRETHPELAKEFHPTLNGDLTPDNITAGRFKPLWWKCSKCGYEWLASPNLRKRGIGCPHCSGRVPLPGIDDLLTLNPKLCEEWDYEKNDNPPSNYKPHSSKKVWWKCSRCGHEWLTTISGRSSGHGCPKCNHGPLKRKKHKNP